MTETSIESYDLEITLAIKKIKDSKAKRILIQLPDGLKPKAKVIVDNLKAHAGKKTNIDIWSGSCYGSCDTPNIQGYDLLIQWGHSEWK
jgi:2-(3-amino-3-carboxypropyl)histidine synthase